MKQTLLFTRFFLAIVTFVIASTSQMAVAGHTIFSSDSCAAIDEKILKLDRFTTMVNNISAFHLEEKASALPVPGITVSNNKKKMLRDAKKKYAEYAKERQKYDCETPMAARTQVANKKTAINKPVISSDKMAVAGHTIFSSDSCADINKKLIQVDAFLAKVEGMSAFHLEEAAVALQNPKISTSNNKKDMLKDANKKKSALLADSQKYGCKPYKKK